MFQILSKNAAVVDVLIFHTDVNLLWTVHLRLQQASVSWRAVQGGDWAPAQFLLIQQVWGETWGLHFSLVPRCCWSGVHIWRTTSLGSVTGQGLPSHMTSTSDFTRSRHITCQSTHAVHALPKSCMYTFRSPHLCQHLGVSHT